MITTTFPHRIDVHHHVIPPAFSKAMEDSGQVLVAGAPLPKWSVQRSLRLMDLQGIQTAVLSLSAPGVYFGSELAAIYLARACNDFCADVARRWPERFGFFAVLPMPFTGPACAEAVRALDILGADGVVLLGSTDGRFLGDSHFDELMAELDRRGSTVFVHPNLHTTSRQLSLDMPGFLVEFLCDTTRAATNLILSGTMERYSRIRWILAHAGGFLPYIAWRLSLANMMSVGNDKAPHGVLTYIRRFWFDTALSPSPYAMAALNELVGPSKILFGSDFPFAPEPVTGLQIRQMDSLGCFDAAQKMTIDRTNALALFPKWAVRGELPHDLPPHSSAGWATLIKRLAIKPVIALADSVRNR
ncbi:amidohydrolase family protein [Aquabacterium sp.]|uniref:amidohydrolase family protein n=1 Tax=Aquabacterium sp. TaxID=1872578 RepID=UPI0035AF7AA4